MARSISRIVRASVALSAMVTLTTVGLASAAPHDGGFLLGGEDGNLLTPDEGNLLGGEDGNLLTPDEGNLLGGEDGNLLGGEDGNLLGGEDGNLLTPDDGNLLGERERENLQEWAERILP